MGHHPVFLGAAALAVFGAVPAAAVTTFTASLNSLNEVQIVESPGAGFGTLTLATDQNSFTIVESYSNLSSNAVAGHVHCCATTSGNAAVAVGFTVPGGLAGSFTQSYDLTVASTYSAGFFNANGGTAASARNAFINGLNAGLAYLNIHTLSNPNGEIRGQLGLAATTVPEPATWGMMIAGFAMVGTAARLRSRKVMVG